MVYDSDPQGLDVLASLNRIGAAINRISQGDRLGVDARLRLIADSAIKVTPGASAVIYTYDQARQAFDPASRVSAPMIRVMTASLNLNCDGSRPFSSNCRGTRYFLAIWSFSLWV